jgi:membrane protease YdiL (CAAX protease family)
MAVPFKSNGRYNYLVTLIILLIIVAVLCAAAFLLVLYMPGALAAAPFSYDTKETYDFEPCSFKIEDLELSYPDGGLILPLYRHEKQEGALILAEGDYSVSGETADDPAPAGIYIIAEEKYFEEMRECVLHIPAEDPGARLEMEQLYGRQPGLPVIWRSMIPLTFVPDAEEIYYYFLSRDGEPLWPPVFREPRGKIYVSLALYSIFTLIVLLIISVFTLDRRRSRYWDKLYRAPPGNPALAAVAAVTLLVLGGEMLPFLSGWPGQSAVSGYLAAAGLLLFLLYNKNIELWELGIARETLGQGYLPAFAAALALMILTRGFPQKIIPAGPGAVALPLLLILLIALARELIWRGFIQTTLGRRWGAPAGLLLTALLAGLLHFAVVAVESPSLLACPHTLVELLVLVPGSAVVLGYLYLRTENILSCALLHVLLLSIASLITF